MIFNKNISVEKIVVKLKCNSSSGSYYAVVRSKNDDAYQTIIDLGNDLSSYPERFSFFHFSSSLLERAGVFKLDIFNNSGSLETSSLEQYRPIYSGLVKILPISSSAPITYERDKFNYVYYDRTTVYPQIPLIDYDGISIIDYDDEEILFM